MEIPAVVQEKLIVILNHGLLRIRSCGWQEDAASCAIEANHLHNIPMLVQKFSVELLEFYLDVEVSEYVRDTKSEVLGEVREAWLELANWLSETKSKE